MSCRAWLGVCPCNTVLACTAPCDALGILNSRGHPCLTAIHFVQITLHITMLAASTHDAHMYMHDVMCMTMTLSPPPPPPLPLQLVLSQNRTIGIIPELKHSTFFNNQTIFRNANTTSMQQLLAVLTRYGYQGEHFCLPRERESAPGALLCTTSPLEWGALTKLQKKTSSYRCWPSWPSGKPQLVGAGKLQPASTAYQPQPGLCY